MYFFIYFEYAFFFKIKYIVKFLKIYQRLAAQINLLLKAEIEFCLKIAEHYYIVYTVNVVPFM